MIRRFASLPWSSIRVKLVLGLLSITVPLIALLLYNNNYSVRVIHNQVAMSNKALISIHMKQLDDQLSEVERHLTGLAFADFNLLTMGDWQASEDQYMMAKSGVSRLLTSDLIVYPYIDGFFVYSLPKRDMMEAYKLNIGYSELNALRQTMSEQILRLEDQPQHANSEWTVMQINGENYIVRLLRSGELYIGAWVKSRTMLAPLSGMHTGETGAVLLVDGAGERLGGTRPLEDDGLDFTQGFQDYYLSGSHNDYLVVGETSRKGDFSLVSVSPDKQILENLPYLANAANFVIVVAIAMLLLSVWFLRKVLLLPLRKLMVGMRLIGEGNLNHQIEESPVPDEFQLVNRTFNQMITQIEELKIHVYEEQLSKQRAELKHLQLQINPHFFMNSLNILYNLAQVKRYELIQEMTMCLVHYFRYMFQSNHPLVQLKDELKHISNYLRIQEMRLPDRLRWEIQVPDYLQMTPIPPLILQTLVENTIKHAVQVDGPVVMSIEATLDTLADEPMVCLLIRDTGKGFTDEALDAIHDGKQITDGNGAHIGLWNTRERLRLQFGERAWMECYNDDPQGAVVELMIPLRPDAESEEGNENVSIVDRG
ncbi:sensor histidine kinase [Cohnella sp.]|uniref:sensor histidine kinase n=1 Tax=Cohnella sp. TaxID=1883426 RepID=UPI0037047E33